MSASSSLRLFGRPGKFPYGLTLCLFFGIVLPFTPAQAAPAAPTNLTAAYSAGQVKLTWIGPAVTNVASYNLYRGTSPGGEGATPYRTISEGSSVSGSFAFRGNGGQASGYVLNGTNSTLLLIGTLDGSAVDNLTYTLSGRTDLVDAQANNLRLTLTRNSTAGSGQLIVNAATVDNDPDDENYNVTYHITFVVNITDLTEIDAGITSGQHYYYKITAVNSSGESAPSNEVDAVIAPAAPLALSAAPSNGQNTLAWTSSFGATSYDLYRGTAAGGEDVTPVQTNVTSPYSDSGLTNGTSYYYRIKALNSGGVSPASNETHATPVQVFSSVVVSPANVSGGESSIGTVTLTTPAPSGGLTVSLNSDSASATVPASVIIPAGATSGSFTISTTSLTASAVAHITASMSGDQVSANLTVVPSTIDTISISPSYISAGDTAEGHVYLKGVAPSGGYSFALSSNDDAVSVPATVTIPAGQTSAVFTVTTTGVAGATPVIVTSLLVGITKTAQIYVVPHKIASLLLSPKSVSGGGTSTGTVTLTGPAGAAGDVVSLSSSHPAATVPETVTVPAGLASVTFQITTTIVDGPTTAMITATNSSGTATAPLTITLVPPTGLTVTPGNGRVTLAWMPMLGVDRYHVYRSTTSGGHYFLLDSVDGNSVGAPTYVDHAALDGKTYYYAVSAIDASNNETAMSSEAATTLSGGSGSSGGSGGSSDSSVGATGSWSAGTWIPCDENGNPLSDQPGDEGYPMIGTPSGSAKVTGEYQTGQQQAQSSPLSLAYLLEGFILFSDFPSNGTDPTPVGSLNFAVYADNFKSSNGFFGGSWLDLSTHSPHYYTGGVSVSEKATLKRYFLFDPVWSGTDSQGNSHSIHPNAPSLNSPVGDTFTPPTSPPATPDHASFLISTHGQSSAMYTPYSGLGPDHLSGGRTGSATFSIGKFGETSVCSASDQDYPEGQLLVGEPFNGRHLMQESPSGNQVEVNVDVTAEGHADSAAPYGLPDASPDQQFTPSEAGALGGMAANVKIDNRAVTIGPVTNMKGPKYNPDGSVAFDANGDEEFIPMPHTIVDGAMYGDIGLPFGISGPSQDNYRSFTFSAHREGSWTIPQSSYNWFSSLKQSGDSNTLYNYDEIPDFSNRYALPVALIDDPNSGPSAGTNPGDTEKVDHIHLDYTDGLDGAEAKADYYLKLHQAEEFSPSQRQAEPVFKPINDVEVDAPGYAVPGLSVNCHWNAPSAVWDYLGGSVGAMSEIPGVDEIPWVGLFCVTAGIAIDHLKPVPDSGSASFDHGWANPASDFPDEADHPHATTDQRLFIMYPHIQGLFTRKYTLKDNWGDSGFTGETTRISDDYVRAADESGTFRYYIGGRVPTEGGE